MTTLNMNLIKLYHSYRNWVSKNPQTVSEIETAFKFLSYFIAGRINSSVILTECVYSVSNLLVLFNDRIIHSSQEKLSSAAEKIKVMLTVLEYSEVFIEISAKNIWGQRGKWIIAISVQLLKLIARMTLLLQYKEKMLSCPPIPPLKRSTNQLNSSKIGETSLEMNNIAFSLKRSGRIIRKVDTAPPINGRIWKPPSLGPPNNNREEEIEEPDKLLLKQHLWGEILYILKPIVHLGAAMRYGKYKWKPWLLAFVMDITSLYLLHSKSRTQNQSRPIPRKHELELLRRRLSLLLYLMRTPFYDKYSKDYVSVILESFARNVPFGRLICQPLKDYIPFWQDTYFYLWSS